MGNQAAFWKLGELDDQKLLGNTQALVLGERRLLARLLAHLVEVEERRLHLKGAFSSMFAYCLSLGMSEDEAGRRLSAATVAKRFPLVYEFLDSGMLSLSVLCKLKHYLTDENHRELLDGVAGLSFRRAEEWLAARFPRPDAPSQIRKVPMPPATPTEPMAPTASNLPATVAAEAVPMARMTAAMPQPDPALAPPSEPRRKDRGLLEPLSESRYRVQFTASQALKDKLDLCRELMAHSNPSLDFAPVVERALDLLLEKLMKKRFARTKKPRSKNERAAREPRRETITSAAKREVLARDGLGCSFESADGKRCGAKAFLEFDHLVALGLDGTSPPENLRLYCRAHNRFHAELDYGKAHVKAAIRRRRAAKPPDR